MCYNSLKKDLYRLLRNMKIWLSDNYLRSIYKKSKLNQSNINPHESITS